MRSDSWKLRRTRLHRGTAAAIVGWLAAAWQAPIAAAQPAVSADTPAAADSSANQNEDVQKVLRHAVFFKFKDGTSAEDVGRVVEAFGALQAKIPEISGYEWGENTGPAAFGNGLTHCFLLSFRDEAGRAAYLPHADHKAFGDVLRPNLDGVFVVDYWATPPEDEPDKPLRHLVFFKFKDDASAADVRAVETAFAELPAKIEAIRGFEWGRNNSPETHDDGFTHCFMVTFDSDAGLAEYAKHPDHTAFATMLRPAVEEFRVIDYWAKPADEGGDE